MDVSDQFHVPAALPLGEETQVITEQEAGGGEEKKPLPLLGMEHRSTSP
jgi:hypothetical protein